MNALVMNCSPVRNGATAAIADMIEANLLTRHIVRKACIDDYSLGFCKGCRSCHDTAECVIKGDDMGDIIGELAWADVIVFVSPSYWADVPGQFKAFIDRCTPWCNTHEPHASIGAGKRGYAVALRTGPSMPECDRIIGSIGHFCGHMEIELRGGLGLCSVACPEDALGRAGEIAAFCEGIQ